MHLPHDLRWPFFGQIKNFKFLWTFRVIMKKSQGEAVVNSNINHAYSPIEPSYQNVAVETFVYKSVFFSLRHLRATLEVRQFFTLCVK